MKKLLVMHFSQASYYFPPHRPKARKITCAGHVTRMRANARRNDFDWKARRKTQA